MTLIRKFSALPAYAGLTAYAGDLHNHCGISYGHGSVEDAFSNARLQLDFASVTGHASWHDMPDDPAHIAAYHRAGFDRLRREWDHVQDVTEAANNPGDFVSFLSFEWHSMTYGDHCIYYDAGRGPLDPAFASDLAGVRAQLRRVASDGTRAMVIPHHIGYRAGHRGINWGTYSEELSPVVELVSMHGSGEDDRGPRPYLHTMGPRDAGSTAAAGLRRGHRFGFIGSTDHHSAHPGSHGYGLAMVWADELTRESVWNAIQRRRTYAITGDRIMLATSVDGHPMGSVAPHAGSREISVDVRGGNALDQIELVRNGEIVARHGGSPPRPADDFEGVLSVGMGWGEVGVPVEWDVELELVGGRIDAVEPRLHGHDTLADQAGATDRYAFSAWEQRSEHQVRLRTRSAGNPSVMMDSVQRLALHVRSEAGAELVARVNGREFRATVADLLQGPRAHYLGAFLSGVFVFDRAVATAELSLGWEIEDPGSGAAEDHYYVRVRQINDQYAWSSPTWVIDPDAAG